jgi:hypothetical protein
MKRSGGGLERLNQSVANAAKSRLNVGWLETALYPDGTPVASVMNIHIHGYGVDTRDPVRPYIQKQTRFLAKVFGSEIKKGSEAPFNAVGEHAVGIIKQGFKAIQSPALSEATVKARLSRRKISTKKANERLAEVKRKQGVDTISKPLIDTGQAKDSISWEVE